MNKKLLFATISCLILTAGCGRSDFVDIEESETEETGTETQTPVQTPGTPTPPAGIDEPRTTSESSYVLEKTSYQTGNLTIHYPQFRQLNDKEKEDSINQWIREEALSYIQPYEDPEVSMDMDYQIMMQTPKIVSIVYTGESSIKGGAYPTHLLFTTNVDITSGKKLKLLDPYTINDALVEALKKGTYLDRENPSQPNQEKTAAVFDFLNSVQNQEWVDALKQADNPNLEENTWGIFTYQTPDSLVASFQVPHALGDHAEIRLDRTTLQ
ncbi:DUF4163 domain-containing protein [Bacillus benzoevorans]|uniref:DUF4163 domain-containing protein n=1 Tax=Bacillus benzoevorans TaxID=1456 RepID=A0A7X0HUZ4_9BACI|nr:DUF4163 domain-containing protein [Bacillus benzoevorans]MBB6447303.1 hypothetical protein [Bacillus benzoevorans]